MRVRPRRPRLLALAVVLSLGVVLAWSSSAQAAAPVLTLPGSIAVQEDTATSLTGIGVAGAVEATLSVPSGSLAAASAGGVVVSGTTSQTVLTGAPADLEAFLSGGGVSFTPPANSTDTVVLTVSATDGTDTSQDTTDLQVQAVNDAPVLTVPISINATEDVPTAVTDISVADVDAGSAAVTLTFGVGSGTLTAASGAGVTVAGSGTGALTLTGSVPDVNAFVSANEVQFTTATNSTANVVLSVDVNDNGNTGSGGALTDSDTTTLLVTAVNDAPVNAVPGPQVVDTDTVLVLSSGDGNRISVSDVDAGAGTVRVTLTATNGLLTLPGTTGLVFLVGDGTNDVTMTVEGAITDLDAALDGLSFSPTAGYSGAASLQVTTSDLGLSGSGGTQTDTDTVAITVRGPEPLVTSVTSGSANGTYGVGSVLSVVVTLDQPVVVDTTGGVPTLLLETGAVDRPAVYVSGSGTTELAFSYTVQRGDESADLDVQGTAALGLNGATIRNSGGDDAVLTLPAPGSPDSLAGQRSLVVDGVLPTAGITVSPALLRAGDVATVTLTFSERVSGLSAGDLSVTVGAISGLGSSDGGLTWTAVLTPDAEVDDPAAVVALDGSGVQDLAGNVGEDATSAPFAVDTRTTTTGPTGPTQTTTTTTTGPTGAPSTTTTTTTTGTTTATGTTGTTTATGTTGTTTATGTATATTGPTVTPTVTTGVLARTGVSVAGSAWAGVLLLLLGSGLALAAGTRRAGRRAR